jgi:mannitol-1-phosphate 5-dehydrogenase
MIATTVSSRAIRAARQTVEACGYALGNLIYRIHTGTLSHASGMKWDAAEIAALAKSDNFIFGGTIATTGFIARMLPLLAQGRIQELRAQGGCCSEIEILKHSVDTATAGCIGAFHLAIPSAALEGVHSMAHACYAKSKFPIVTLIDVGGTKIEVQMVQLGRAGELLYPATRSRRIQTPKNLAPPEFYNRVAAVVFELVATLGPEAYEVLPISAVSQPGHFQSGKGVIGEDSARDLGSAFPGSRPSELLADALAVAGAGRFDVYVCNDGRAQFVGILETIRRDDPDQWRKLSGKKWVYLGVGTGLGFAYGFVNPDGALVVHNLRLPFDLIAREPWEELPVSSLGRQEPIARLGFQYRDVISGKFFTRQMHALEAFAGPLFTPCTHLAHGSRAAIEAALENLPHGESPLNAALINEILADSTLDAVTEMSQRLRTKSLLATLDDTLANFSHALRVTTARNMDVAQTRSVIGEIERAVRRGKRIQFIGIGKSHSVGLNLAQISTNLGIPALWFELTGANCENISGLAEDDVVFLISNSGESRELLALFPNLTEKRCITIALTGDISSQLVRLCRYRLSTYVEREAHPHKEAPTTSTTVALAVGAAHVIAASRHLPHDAEEFMRNRPGLFIPVGSRFSGLRRDTQFDDEAKVTSVYRALATSIDHIRAAAHFGPALLALARRIQVSHERGQTVFFTGAAGCYSVAQKIAATLTSIGIGAQAENCAQLPHGDLGQIGRGKLLIMLSFRGETETLLELADQAKAKGVELALITGRRNSSLTHKIDLCVYAESIIDDQHFVRLPDQTIFASFLNLAVGDALAVILSHMNPISKQEFAGSHPGGVFARAEGRMLEDVLLNLSSGNIENVLQQVGDTLVRLPIIVCREQLESYIARRRFPKSGSPEVIVAGMGAIGLAFLAPLLRALDKEIWFIETNALRVRAMDRAYCRYKAIRVGASTSSPGEEIDISRVSVIHLRDGSEDEIATLALRVDQMFTAVGAANLQHLASLLAKIAVIRYVFRIDAPFNVICCENLPVGGDTIGLLGLKVLETLGHHGRGIRDYARTHIGFVAAVDEAIVPQVEADFLTTMLIEADQAPLYVDASAWERGNDEPLPEWPGVHFVSRFPRIHERKLLVHNMAHAVIAYLGYYRWYSEMSDAVEDVEIRALAQQSANAVADVLYDIRSFSDTLHPDRNGYVEWLFRRYSNPSLQDQVKRVCRDPLRKLAQFDRLIGALTYVVNGAPHISQGQVAMNLKGTLMGIAAAMRYAADTQPETSYADIRESVLRGFPLDSRYLEEAEVAFEEFRQGVSRRDGPIDGLASDQVQ